VTQQPGKKLTPKISDVMKLDRQTDKQTQGEQHFAESGDTFFPHQSRLSLVSNKKTNE